MDILEYIEQKNGLYISCEVFRSHSIADRADQSGLIRIKGRSQAAGKQPWLFSGRKFIEIIVIGVCYQTNICTYRDLVIIQRKS